MKHVLLLTFFIFPCCLFSQTAPSYIQDLQRTDFVALAKLHHQPYVLYLDNGSRATYQGRYANGFPKYVMALNQEAAGITKVTAFHSRFPGINGEGMIAGVWDEKNVRRNHVEHVNKVSIRETPYEKQWHATHVAGTIAARGIDPKARGMAPATQILSYDWDNDNIEMLDAILKDSLRISNHSYGFLSGWLYVASLQSWTWFGDTTISGAEDSKYGYYDQQSQVWDDIHYQHPEYLALKAAGNDRGKNIDSAAHYNHLVYDFFLDKWVPSTTPRAKNGDYDCLAGGGNAKNVLTVGAIDKLDVTGGINSAGYSSWGPSDDGRIKPDIVGVGSKVYSSTDENNHAYGEVWGTSMATPNVSGALLLLHQLYQKTYKSTMNGYMIKAIALHSAGDAGTPGPDYSYGWGVLNADSAARVVLKEKQLFHDTSISLQDSVIFYFYSKEPEFKTTLTWYDPPAAVSAPALDDRTPKLVNDLDLKVIRVRDGMNFFPFRLNPVTPEAVATTGVNTVDNVEQVRIFSTAPQHELYKVVVTYKSSAYQVAEQRFALVTGEITSHIDKEIISIPALPGINRPADLRAIFPFTPPSGSTVNWRIGDSTIQDSLRHTFTETGLYTVGCTLVLPGSGQEIPLPEKQVRVYPDTLTIVPFDSISFTKTSVCAGSSIPVKDQFSFPAGIQSSSFSFEGGSPAADTGLQSISINYSVPGTYGVKATVTFSDGHVQELFIPDAITVEPVLAIDKRFAPQQICSPLDPALFNIYPYDHVDILYNNSVLEQPFYFPTSGTYTLYFRNTSPVACKSDDSMQLLVFPTPPKPSIFFDGDTLRCSPESYITIWYYNDDPVASGIKFHPPFSANYKVGIKSSQNGCEIFSDYFNFIAASVHDYISERELILYPNPARAGFYIRNTSNYIPEICEVMDMSGRLVLRSSLLPSAENFISLAEQQAGIYFIRIAINGQWVNRKLVLTGNQ